MKQRLTAKEEEIMTIFWEHGEMFHSALIESVILFTDTKIVIIN